MHRYRCCRWWWRLLLETFTTTIICSNKQHKQHFNNSIQFENAEIWFCLFGLPLRWAFLVDLERRDDELRGEIGNSLPPPTATMPPSLLSVAIVVVVVVVATLDEIDVALLIESLDDGANRLTTWIGVTWLLSSDDEIDVDDDDDDESDVSDVFVGGGCSNECFAAAATVGDVEIDSTTLLPRYTCIRET